MEVAGGNDGALAAGIVIAAMMQLFVLKRPRTLVQTGPFFFFFSLISLIADEPHHYHPACGHK